MSKRVVKELRYEAPLDAVAAMLADETFREQVLERQRVLRGSVSIEGERVRIEQVQHAEGIPAFAKKFVGEEITILQEEQWRSPTHGDIHVSIPGKPGDMRGTAVLTETDTGTLETVDLQVSVHIPLVGGKIEGLIADMLSRALDKEHETGVDWLG